MSIRQFLVVVIGGALLGLLVGYAASKITAQVDEPRIEITLTTIVAYGSYLLAEQLHVSGVIATVVAGLTIGNYGARQGMSPRTRVSVWSFWEYLSFLANSLIFLLIGIEVHVGQILESWWTILIALGAVLLGRTLVVYALSPLSGRFGVPIPARWNPVMVWGGLHGSVSIALALSLPENFPYRSTLLTLCFGVVAFSIVVQGLTMKPLLRWLGIVEEVDRNYSMNKAKQLTLSASRTELDLLREMRAGSQPVYETLSHEIEKRALDLEAGVRGIQAANPELVEEEMRQAKLRMLTAERSALQRGVIEGIVEHEISENILAEAAEEIDRLTRHSD